MRINHGVRLTGQRCSLGVANRKDLRAKFLGITNGHERVHGFAGLRNGYHQSVWGDNRAAVAELVRKFDLHRNPRPFFYCVLGDITGIGCGAASNDDDAVDVANLLGRHLLNVVKNHTTIGTNAAHQGVGNRLWLVGDLFGHERWPAAFGCCRGIPVDFELFVLHRSSVEAINLDRVRLEHNNLVLPN